MRKLEGARYSGGRRPEGLLSMELDGVEAAAAPFGEGVVVAGYVVGDDYGFGDVVADVVFADKIYYVGFFESLSNTGLNTG